MAYTALYRKKRPRTFGELVGQSPITRTLLNQLKAGHVSHAYLFCGTRGTGKTSAAKIFSRAVNCQNPQEGEPCNVCSVCESILAERNMGVIEIDAASNNGVENIRDLREEVKYPPTEGKYKVYIIDEAHMLTTSAFNALLKTLEEPPAHVIFILATTDPQKIPVTILSRCQRYDFKRITAFDMTQTLRRYLQSENASIEEDALAYIASISDGAMRDALSLADQCLSFYPGETVTLTKLLQLLGAVDRQLLFDFADALRGFDAGRALTLIDTLIKDGRDAGQFASDFTRHCRDLLVASQTENAAEILDCTGDRVLHLQTQGKAFDYEILIGYISAFSDLQNELRYSAYPRTALEVCALRLCNPMTQSKMEALYARLAKLEQALQDGSKPVSEGIAPNAVVEPPVSAPASFKPLPAPAPIAEAIGRIQGNWQDFCKQFKNPMRSMMTLCRLVVTDERFLYLVCNDQTSLLYLKDRQSLLSDTLLRHFSLEGPLNLAFITQQEYNKRYGGINTQSDKTQTVPAPKKPQAESDPSWEDFTEQMDMDNAFM